MKLSYGSRRKVGSSMWAVNTLNQLIVIITFNDSGCPALFIMVQCDLEQSSIRAKRELEHHMLLALVSLVKPGEQEIPSTRTVFVNQEPTRSPDHPEYV